LAARLKQQLQVNDGLQSVSHPSMFGAGDIMRWLIIPVPKAGVFALRQGQTAVLQQFCGKTALKPLYTTGTIPRLVDTGNKGRSHLAGSFM